MNGHLSIFLLCLSAVATDSVVKPGCDPECPGPAKYYREIGCQAVFKTPEDCCPWKWNCDHIRNRPKNKCYAYGVEYKVGDLLKKADLGCRQRCVCTQKNPNESASFICTRLAVTMPPVPAECYRPRNATMCFPAPDVCPEKQEDIPKCEVDGKIYKAGEFFSSKKNPRLECYCGAGWKGEFVMPFCKDTTQEPCGFELEHGLDIINNCLPYWRHGKSNNVLCNDNWICPDASQDQIIRKKSKGQQGSAPPAGSECRYGNNTLKLDESVMRDHTSHCIMCKCKIPPVPTCSWLPKDYCDVISEEDESSEEQMKN